MIYVAFMTFILIMSSVTMVLAVDAGHEMKKNRVIWYMFLLLLEELFLLDLRHGNGLHSFKVIMELFRPKEVIFYNLERMSQRR